jgi:hypothetical protein
VETLWETGRLRVLISAHNQSTELSAPKLSHVSRVSRGLVSSSSHSQQPMPLCVCAPPRGHPIPTSGARRRHARTHTPHVCRLAKTRLLMGIQFGHSLRNHTTTNLARHFLPSRTKLYFITHIDRADAPLDPPTHTHAHPIASSALRRRTMTKNDTH